MLRWDEPDRENPHTEWVETRDGHLVRRHVPGYSDQPARPRDWEAHRRHRHYDPDTGAIVREDHEAVRLRFWPRKLLPGPVKEPPVLVSIMWGAMLHGAIWWAVMWCLTLTPSPWFAVIPAGFALIFLGIRFVIANLLWCFVIGGVFLAFDGWPGWLLMLPLAGLTAPGRWIGGEW